MHAVLYACVLGMFGGILMAIICLFTPKAAFLCFGNKTKFNGILSWLVLSAACFIIGSKLYAASDLNPANDPNRQQQEAVTIPGAPDSSRPAQPSPSPAAPQ